MNQLKATFRLCLIAFAVSLAFAGTVSAQEESVEDKARAHFRLGRAHYDNGNFAEAAVEFEEAYNVSQRAALLYNIYLAYRDANNTQKAAWALKLYLEKEENIENRAQLQARLRALEEANAAQAAAGTATPVVAATPTAEQPATEPAPEAQPAPDAATQADEPKKKSNVVPFVLMGTGGAMVIGSIATGVMASGKKSEAEELCPSGVCPTAEDEAKAKEAESSQGTLALVTDILMFGGIAVAGTGAVLWLLNLTSGGDEETATVPYKPTASLACAPGACHGSMQMHF